MRFRNLFYGYGASFSIALLIPIVIIGLSVFLRNFSNAIANTFFLPLLADIANKAAEGNSGLPSGQYYQTLSGAV